MTRDFRPYNERWRNLPIPSKKEDIYDMYEPVTEDEFFDFVYDIEDLLSEGALKRFGDILGKEGKFTRKLWLRSQGVDIYLTVEKK